jgi:hypothetical protein
MKKFAPASLVAYPSTRFEKKPEQTAVDQNEANGIQPRQTIPTLIWRNGFQMLLNQPAGHGRPRR